MSLLDNIEQSVAQMSEEDLRKEFLKMQEETSKRREKQKQYNTSPENKQKRLAYQKERNEKLKSDPAAMEKLRAQRKAYMAKNKDKQLEYRKKRNALQKLIMQRAKELGIDKQVQTA